MRRLLKMTQPYTAWLVGGMLAGLLSGGSMLGVFLASPDLISSLSGNSPASTRPSQLELLAASIGVFPRAQDGGMTPQFLLLIMVCLAGFLMTKAIFEFVNRYCMRRVGAMVVCDLRNQLFSHLQRQSLAYYSKVDVGQLVSRCTGDTSVIEGTIASTVADLAKAPFDVLAGFLFVVTFAWHRHLVALPLTMFIVIPICMVPIFTLGRRVRRYNRNALARVGDLTSRMHENFTGIRIVKAYHTEAQEEQRFVEASRGYQRQVLKSIVAALAMTPLMQIVATAAACFFLFYCFSNRIQLAVIAPMAIAAFYSYEPIKKLAKVNGDIQRMMAAADRIFEILDVNEIIPESPDARQIKSFNDRIAIRDVSFRYKKSGAPVLSEVSLDVERGSLVALVGATGSGKSTLSSLVARFYDVTQGSICLDGVDLREIETASLRRLIGVVNQETILFNSSIADNIRYGSPDATQDEIEAAAKLAHAHDFIVADVGGYDHVVGDKGFQLSGGQRQRICIARAILRNPQILILDEATSALDTQTEKLVQSALDNLMRSRTVIAIAHRLSTIQHATQIVVLDHGRIVERGTHDQLLAANGHYARLHSMQHDGIIGTT